MAISEGTVKLFFTGGTGFFGKAILRYLKAQYQVRASHLPEQVVVLSRAPDDFKAHNPEFANLNWLRFHLGDIGCPESLPKNQTFTHVLHAAADSTDASRMSHLQRHNQIVEGTKNLLEFALRVGAARFLLTSSGGVYGPQPDDLTGIPESYLGMPDPLNPNNVYGVAKRQAEHLCALYRAQYGLETIIARCFAFVGQDLPLNAHFAIGNFIRDALWHSKIIVAGDGTPVRSYLDQRDLAHWLLALLEHGQAGHAYNVGSDQAISIGALAHLVRDIISKDKPVCILGNMDKTKARECYIPDIKQAKTTLGLEVKISLEKSISETSIILKEAVSPKFFI
jgi:dTDP-glucose 4,6-dehydratase